MAEREIPPQEQSITEKYVVKRITFAHFLNSLLDAFNLERGGIFTLKKLFLEPGRLVRGYLTNERFRVTPPIRMLLVTTTVAVLIFQYTEFGQAFQKGWASGGSNSEISSQSAELFNGNINIFLWLYIPFAALFTWLLNRKSVYNFAEHLVFQTYLSVLSNLFTLWYLLHPRWGFVISLAFTLFYYVLAYRQFFRKNWFRSSAETLLMFLLSLVVYSVVLGIVMTLVMVIGQFKL